MAKIKDKKDKLTRRSFIKNTSVTSAGFMIVPRHILGGKGYVAPSDKINIGIAGAGGRVMGIIRGLFNHDDAQIISIADPAEFWKNDILYREDSGRGPTKKRIEEFYSQKKANFKVSEYEDFREMLRREKALDAIVCASPDNTHAYISIMSMNAGKHVYCEKPLTHNIWEARKMREVAKKTGLATQMGNQLHNLDTIRQTVEYLRAGTIGKVKEAHLWVSATRWIPELNGFPTETDPIPQGFNWNLWLGPTIWKPFNKLYTPVKWRDFWVFGCGAMGDFGCHEMDAATWAFELQSPETVEVLPGGNKGNRDIAPYAEIGYYKFAAKGKQQDIDITWYSGGLQPKAPDVLPANISLKSRGAIFIGEKGVLLNNGGASSPPELYPESLRNSFIPPVQSIPRVKGHEREWLDAIKGGPAALSNFDYAATLTEITLLGVLSLRLGGQKIYWDAQNMKATGLPAADEFIREPVRKGWEME